MLISRGVSIGLTIKVPISISFVMVYIINSIHYIIVLLSLFLIVRFYEYIIFYYSKNTQKLKLNNLNIMEFLFWQIVDIYIIINTKYDLTYVNIYNKHIILWKLRHFFNSFRIFFMETYKARKTSWIVLLKKIIHTIKLLWTIIW